MTKIKAQKLISIKGLFRNAWRYYKKDFKKFLIIVLIFWGITNLVLQFIGPELPKIPETEIESEAIPAFVPPQAEPVFTVPWYVFFAIVLIGVLIGILGSVSLISAIKKGPKEWRIKDVIKEGWSKYWSFVWVTILTGAVVLGGFLFLVIPGIIFAIQLIFSGYIVICEDKKRFSALARSEELVKGYWWPVVIRILALNVVLISFSLVLQFIPYVGWLASVILFFPFTLIYNYLIYQNLKEIKEGEKLMSQRETLIPCYK